MDSRVPLDLLRQCLKSTALAEEIYENAKFLSAMESRYSHSQYDGWSLKFDVDDENRVFQRCLNLNAQLEEPMLAPSYKKKKKKRKEKKKKKKSKKGKFSRRTFDVQNVKHHEIEVSRLEFQGCITFSLDYESLEFDGHTYLRD